MADRPMRAHLPPATSTAAAVRMSIPRVGTAASLTRAQFRQLKTSSWQKQAWAYYDTTPELRFAANWLGQACSQTRLYVGEVDPDGSADPTPVTDENIMRFMRTLYGGYARQPEMLSRMAVQLTVCGQTILCHGYLPEPGGTRTEIWHTASTDEITGKGDQRVLRLDDGTAMVPLPEETDRDDDSFVLRIWTPHARRAWEADAPTRALIGTCAEITGFTNYINATIDSRLSGAGVAVLSEDAFPPAPVHMPVDPSPDGQTDAPGDAASLTGDPVVDAFTHAMMASLGDADSAARVVPIVLRVPGKANEAFSHHTFATELSDKAVAMRDAAVKRFAIGADIPPEILLGIGSTTNHWNAWKISADSITLHVEPMMATICDALTQHYLTPLIIAELGEAAAGKYAVWFDTSRLTDDGIDGGDDARELYKLGLLKGEAAVRSAGYSTDDMPDERERAQVLLTQLATSGVDITVAQPYLAELARLGFGTDERPEQPAQTTTPEEMAAITASAGSVDARLFAAHACILRALEIAGKRLLTSANRARYQQTPAWNLHTKITYGDADIPRMLRGAFDITTEIFDADTCNAITETVRSILQQRIPYESTGHLAQALGGAK